MAPMAQDSSEILLKKFLIHIGICAVALVAQSPAIDMKRVLSTRQLTLGLCPPEVRTSTNSPITQSIIAQKAV